METKYSNVHLASQVYLSLVPFAGTVLAFGIGYVDYHIYLPAWLLNTAIMIIASWHLGLHSIRNQNNAQRKLVLAGFFLIIPFILASMFAGLGPPPETPEKWVLTATEQQIRYFMLTAIGTFVVLGFTLIKSHLKSKGEHFYSLLGQTALLIAIPLFVINMLFWGFYLPAYFKVYTTSGLVTSPDWYQPIQKLFGMISVFEVALTYVATFLFAKALHITDYIGRTGMWIYSVLCAIGFILIVLSPFLAEPFFTLGNIVSIPAFPFLMPYFMGIHLVKSCAK